MKKVCVRLAACILIAAFAWLGTLLSDRQRLREELIRIHVVANSDSPEDQSIKLRVRDAVMGSLRKDLQNISDADQAKLYLQEKLPYIQSIAGQTLRSLGCQDSVRVTLQKEAFEQKSNAVFSLPAGVYQSLRITIGSGQGQNWWSVVFPEVCDTVSEEDGEVAAVSGFPASPEEKTAEGIEIRFYFLDVLGKLENIFFRG